MLRAVLLKINNANSKQEIWDSNLQLGDFKGMWNLELITYQKVIRQTEIVSNSNSEKLKLGQMIIRKNKN